MRGKDSIVEPLLSPPQEWASTGLHRRKFAYRVPNAGPADIEKFIADWRGSGGSELANTQSLLNGPCTLIGLNAATGSRTDYAHNDNVFERCEFQDIGDCTQRFRPDRLLQARDAFMRTATHRAALDALAGIGMARRPKGGGYAA